MSEEIELKLLREIEELKEKLGIEEEQNNKKVYQYSNISYNLLKTLVDIKENIDNNVFQDWFENDIEIDDSVINMFSQLIKENEVLVDKYNEEDLKVNVIIPILNKVKFKSFEKKFRDFYELPLTYESEKFIFNGTTDFVVSKGLVESEKPYFFIQEFKKGKQNSYPEAQLLAELIAGIELNNWQKIKGAYIVGSLWYFVILEKLDNNKYQYFVSKKFDSMRLDDLKQIYKNLLFIKEEIIHNLDLE